MWLNFISFTDALKKINQMDMFDLTDKFVDISFNSIDKLKLQMIETLSIFNLFQSKMSKEFELIQDKVDDRTKVIFNDKKISQEKYLKELDEALLKVNKVLTENFNLLKFMGNLKVEEAIIVEAKENIKNESLKR